MHVRARSFALHKQGNDPEDYEDAVWPARPVDREVSGFRCAVADGATETSFSGCWAEMLTRAWCRGELREGRREVALSRLRAAWWRQVSARPLPWYAEAKLQSGAFSSLLGLTLWPEGGWVAAALGDSCLFQVRSDRLLTAFPLIRSGDFSSRPFLLSSRASGEVVLQQAAGEWQPGDAFYLATDALACWFLRSHEEGRLPWAELPAGGAECFTAWVKRLRQKRTLRNDDVTLMALSVD